jgi:hypothetical protein
MANRSDYSVVLRLLVKKEVASGEGASGRIVVNETVREDDDSRQGHQAFDMPKNVNAAAVPERGIQNRDVRCAIQNHGGGFFQVRRFSYHSDAGDFLKTLLEFVAKEGICVGKDDGHARVVTRVSVLGR